MDQNNSGFGSGSGFNTTTGSDRPSSTGPSMGSGPTNFGAAGTGIGTHSATEVCAHCGQPLHPNRGIEEFLGRIGISEDMINNLKTQMQNVDIDEYLNTARDYFKSAGKTMKTGSDKAGQFAKENPGKVAAGVAVLAVGAGLLLNSLRDRE
ncbi:MAG TPA: hypothetical protein VF980_06535 [Thermoanaerobaculia bacterium]